MEVVVVSLSVCTRGGGWVGWWLSLLMCWWMAATEVASLVRSSRSAAADDARLIRASSYSAGGWVMGVCVCWAKLLWKPAC